MGFPGGSDGKETACNAGDLRLIPGLGNSLGGRHSNPLQYSCLENPHGQKSLEGYSPWSCKVSDMTERLGTHQPLWLQPCPGTGPEHPGVTFLRVKAHSCSRQHLSSLALKLPPLPWVPSTKRPRPGPTLSSRLFPLSKSCSKQFLPVALCNSRTSINHS